MSKKTKKNIWLKEFTNDGISITKLKIGLRLIATIDDKQRPHITMISSNEAFGPKQIVWGQFTEGLSKKYVLNNPKQAAFYMTGEPPYVFVQAKMHFTHFKKGGDECEYFSRLPLLRYMTYTNIHTAYYNDVVAVTPVRKLSILGIVKGVLTDLLLAPISKEKSGEGQQAPKLGEIGDQVFNDVMAGKFISFIDPKDGYPVILPCFQIRSPDLRRLIFPLSQFKDELLQIPKGAKVSVYGIQTGDINKPELVNQMVMGTYLGLEKKMGIKCGIIEIDEVYNSMPPLMGWIYPKLDIREKVEDFPV